ncbi:MAG: Asp-tRNA(Asn)/Glu-tRNA(Gln) amidotransferase subunit GatB [Rhodothermales bacterium]|nr:Asp-tRNA(Asn)/Glu-tRNA(Gln) amidotransferase subunit GatB [Rhodothermales bacterium]
MRDEKYEAVIGLEVHCQLATDSKAFSPESASFGAEPNRHIDPVSLGHPGTLPVLNDRVVPFSVRMGLATHCAIAPRSELARKHYFYPDLPKGYQITQYDTPICAGGYLDLIDPEFPDVTPRRIGITRIHIEEDAGKSVHDLDVVDTLLDYNRCGVPLIEIVSEPDLRTPREAFLYLQKIRQIVRYLDICDGNMEEGSLRCDANVSIRRRGETRLGTKAEIKNVNSFRNVERAIAYEIRRQVEIVEGGGEIRQETRLWDAVKLETRSMRSKEFAHDYRYFPDPDLVPIVVGDALRQALEASLPELPEARSARYVEQLGLPAYDAQVLTEERPVADYFEALLTALPDAGEATGRAKAASNFVMSHVMRALNERGLEMAKFPIAPVRLAGLVRLRLSNSINSSAAHELFEAMLDAPDEAEALASARNLIQVSDTSALLPIVQDVLDEHPAEVALYLSGKQGLIGFFVGQVMKRYPGSPDPKAVRTIIAEQVASRNV